MGKKRGKILLVFELIDFLQIAMRDYSCKRMIVRDSVYEMPQITARNSFCTYRDPEDAISSDDLLRAVGQQQVLLN